MAFEKAIAEIEHGADLLANPSFAVLRRMAAKEGAKSRFGSLCFQTRVTGRSSKCTEVFLGNPSEAQEELADEVAGYLKGRKLIMLDRQMCQTKPFLCRSYVSAAYPHIAYMWGRMLFSPRKNVMERAAGRPDFVNVQVPEWPETKILVDAEKGITFILGSDYTGELKKANLRMAMYRTKQGGGIGMHAGSKFIRYRDRDGNISGRGVLLFGLSATGKTTLTCHHHWLDALKGEGVVILQDDVVLMQKDSSCLGTEDNFYIKTEGLDKNEQPLLYKAALSRHALFENVKELPDGGLDFLDGSRTTNGRGVVLRKEIGCTDRRIDLKRADIVLFITRRNTIVPPVAKLDEVMGAAFFMLGESVGSSAADVGQGKSIRVVGMNPFIVGNEDEEGNRFHDLLKGNPHLECYLLNTGKVGDGGDGPGEKITVRDSATIIREIARGTVEWRKDSDWGYEVLDYCPGVDVSKFHPERHYTKEQYARLTDELRTEREAWLAGFPKLYPEIRSAF